MYLSVNLSVDGGVLERQCSNRTTSTLSQALPQLAVPLMELSASQSDRKGCDVSQLDRRIIPQEMACHIDI